MRAIETTPQCFRTAERVSAPEIVLLSGGKNRLATTQRSAASCQSLSDPTALSLPFGRALQRNHSRGAECGALDHKAAV